MYQRILTAVDGSECADLALKHAIRIAKNENALLDIVYVVDTASITLPWASPAPYPVDIGPMIDALRSSGKEILGQAATKAREAGVKVEVSIEENFQSISSIATVLADAAKRVGADLIVVGTHGRRGLGRLLLGSVAESLARIAPAPVLLVRSKDK